MFVLKKKFCVYVDFVKIDGKFIAGYVGKGNQGRVNCVGRNQHWNRINDKYGWKRVIVFQTHDEEHAFEVEKMWIHDLHTYRYDPQATAYACNYTLGGEGPSGLLYTKEMIQKNRDAQNAVLQRKRAAGLFKTKDNSSKTKVLAMRLPIELHDKIVAYAQAYDMTVSEVIKEVLNRSPRLT